MDRFLASWRYALRLLLKSPGFAVTAILILGFGIGANTAMFGLIQTVVVNALPFPSSDQLVHISQPKENDRYWSGVSYLDYLDISTANHTLDTLAISEWDFFDLNGPTIPETGHCDLCHTDFVPAHRPAIYTGKPVYRGRG